MSEQPQSGDGLVLPEAFPVKSSSMNVETVRAAAGSLRSMGTTVDSHMDNIVAVWAGLPGVYEGPGAEQAYGIMGPASSSAESLKETLDKAASAIEDFADAVEPVKKTLEGLEKEAVAFRAEALAGYDGKSWREHQPAVDRNAELLGRYAAVVEALTSASSACANRINGLHTQSTPVAFEVISADAIMQSGEMMPWGAPVEKDRNCGESVVHGAGNFLKSTWDGAKAMVGFGPEGWSVDTLASTWVGVADFVGSTALLASPVLSQGIKLVGGDDVDAWVDRRHDVAKTALGSFVGYDHMAAKDGGDGWHKWKEDGVAALTESVLNIGTCFIPGAGVGGAAAKVAVSGSRVAMVGAKAVKLAVNVADFAIPGGGHLVKGLSKLVKHLPDASPVRLADDVSGVKPRINPAGAVPNTPVTNTLDLRGGATPPRSGGAPSIDSPAAKAPRVPASNPAQALDEAADPVRSPRHPDPETTSGRTGHDRPGTPESQTPEPRNVSTDTAQRATSATAQRATSAAARGLNDAAATLTDAPAGGGHTAPGTSAGHGGGVPESTSTRSPEPHLPDPERVKTPDPEDRIPDRTPDEDHDTLNRQESSSSPDRDPNQFPGEEPNPGAERRSVPKGERDWWYDTDGDPHAKGDHHPESTYRDVEGRLQNKNGGFATDTNPPEKPDLVESRRELSEHPEGYREHLDTITDDPPTTYTEDLNNRNELQQEHLADFRSLKTLTKDANISIKGFRMKNIDSKLDDLVNTGSINRSQAREIRNLFETERESLKALGAASEDLGIRATDGLLYVRGEISLYGPMPTSGSKLLDQVGITLDPPSITVYEAKGIGGDLGDIEIDGKRYQQGTSQYLQKLMNDDPRFAQGLEDLIRREGPKAKALIEAIRNGDITINYDLVHAKANGTIDISRFILDAKPTLPDIKLP